MSSNEPISVQEALIYVMVIVSASDNAMTDKELATIGDMIKMLPVFETYNENRIIPAAQRCGDILQEENGLSLVLELVGDVLPAKLYDTAYALAVEVAAADLHVEQEELRVLQMLRDRFSLDKLTVAAIERGAIARHRKV
ncbi:tellurite resistance protein [Labrenzia sp. EL_208]|uniref:Tellurite resistance protein TerB n=2 Tax=Roseibium album TaxID=311410 RepID=A0A0M6ZF45_9HYPH|nr:tellurite resistance protein [Labrenzia sp. EL_142]MBG6155221.1 tellurite resistance protein [Labrenzia sp. EL_162]MBG6162481.1 tellurite resistance protein [Labrenzia sp. EL_195]MBG6173799.1 tellurite resistance protein [Labrenzia sp. EL_132]MBG6192649.1 tellurite resistance protein [Labrenzia sp. EL_159]MBG6199038.1 tellurite resistance protein [Labrenzia sp. EL_13]MBG6207014.1 tellurite resistance protein [Labrenzia sp. EL_126]MBG6228745.1 tellurite resistance protein [Labrenzia sp. EL